MATLFLSRRSLLVQKYFLNQSKKPSPKLPLFGEGFCILLDYSINTLPEWLEGGIEGG